MRRAQVPLEAAEAPDLLGLREQVAAAGKLALVVQTLADIPDRADEAGAIGSLDTQDRELHRKGRAVGAHRDLLAAAVEQPSPAAVQAAREASAMAGTERRRHDQLGELPPQRLLAGVAEHRLGAAAELKNTTVPIDHHNRGEVGAEQRAGDAGGSERLRLDRGGAPFPLQAQPSTRLWNHLCPSRPGQGTAGGSSLPAARPGRPWACARPNLGARSPQPRRAHAPTSARARRTIGARSRQPRRALAATSARARPN